MAFRSCFLELWYKRAECSLILFDEFDIYRSFSPCLTRAPQLIPTMSTIDTVTGILTLIATALLVEIPPQLWRALMRRGETHRGRFALAQ